MTIIEAKEMTGAVDFPRNEGFLTSPPAWVLSDALDSPDRITKCPAAPQTDGRLLLSPAAPDSRSHCTTVPSTSGRC